jgi:membrane protein involved in colicin uptake
MTTHIGSGGSDPTAHEMREVFDLKSRAEQELAQAAEIRRAALTEAEAIVLQAQQLADGVSGDAENRKALAAAEAKGRAEQILADARARADEIAAAAERNAHEAAADAAAARAEAERTEASAQALLAEARKAAETDRAAAQRETRALIDEATAIAASQADTALRDLVTIASALRDSMAAASIRLGDILDQLGDVTDKFAAARQGDSPSSSSRFRRGPRL